MSKNLCDSNEIKLIIHPNGSCSLYIKVTIRSKQYALKTGRKINLHNKLFHDRKAN